VTTVSHHGDDHLLVGHVVGKHFLEPVTQVVELIFIDYLALKHLRLDLSLARRVNAGRALGILEAGEPVAGRAGGQQYGLGTCSASGVNCDPLSVGKQVLLLVVMVIIHIFRVVIIILLGHHVGIVNPSAEVTWLVSGALSCSEPGTRVSVIAKRVNA